MFIISKMHGPYCYENKISYKTIGINQIQSLRYNPYHETWTSLALLLLPPYSTQQQLPHQVLPIFSLSVQVLHSFHLDSHDLFRKFFHDALPKSFLSVKILNRLYDAQISKFVSFLRTTISYLNPHRIGVLKGLGACSMVIGLLRMLQFWEDPSKCISNMEMSRAIKNCLAQASSNILGSAPWVIQNNPTSFRSWFTTPCLNIIYMWRNVPRPSRK